MREMKIKSITPVGKKMIVGLEVLKNHTYLSSNGIVNRNCDRLSPQAQDSMKATLETFSKNCSFVFISNHKNKIIDPIQSRMQDIQFGTFTKEEAKLNKKAFFRVCLDILTKENVEFDKQAVAQIVNTLAPDFRRTLNSLQQLSQQGKITLEAVNENIVTDLGDYFSHLKNKDFGKVRKYISNLNIDLTTFCSHIYKELAKYMKSDSIPEAILLVAKYQFETSQVVDPEIGLAALSIEMMSECEFK